jgi:protoheme IX farnesyltransferase
VTQLFRRYAWGVLVYNIAAVLWGAYVRASNSGAGCGNQWPSCGMVLEARPDPKSLVEFTHRASIALGLFLLIGLMVLAYRTFPKGHVVRKAVWYSFAFTISEALIGAALVLFKLVEHDASAYRAVAMTAHLTNTFLLLGSLTLTAWWTDESRKPQFKNQGATLWMLALALLSMLLLGMSGALVALIDTLIPADHIADALRRHWTPTAQLLVNIRILHPILALSVGLFLVLVAGLATHLRPSPAVRQMARFIGTIFLLQIGVGLVNRLLLAPIPLQMVHLLLADSVWVAVVLLTAAAVTEGVPHVELSNPTLSKAALAELGPVSWQDYLALTKPRVISLLLFTALTAMFIAKGGWPGLLPFIAVAIGFYCAAGSANAINMVIDRDIDGRMKRTSTRPTVTQKIPARDALVFALLLEIASFAILWGGASILSALLALAGLVYYIIVYTMLLKRRTWNNIVIGGAAGAFPPLVGWTAVADLNSLAWFLFAMIFLWTPVHFWALAILLKDDYAEAGVPMLPVVRGVQNTALQIGFYTILTVALSLAPFFMKEMSWIYAGAAVLLNLVLILRSAALYRKPDRPQASSLFHYSMLYLALLFLAMAVDRVWLPIGKA